VQLVAGRELREAVRSKAYRVSTVLMVVAAAAAVTLPTVLRNSDRGKTDIGVVGTLDVSARAVVAQTAQGTGVTVVFRDLADRDAAAKAVRDGAVHVAIVDRSELLIRRALAAGETSPRARFITLLSAVVPLSSVGTLPVNALEPASSHAATSADRATGYAAVLLIFMFLMTYGSWIVNGVTEEKTSRLVELLLASVRPADLMVGKVAGVGAAAAAQAALVAGTAYVVALAIGVDAVRDVTGRVALIGVVWFVLGYALYGFAYAAAGATVARPEDARLVATPLSIPMIVGYTVPISALASGQDSTLMRALSFFPPSAPFTVVMRSAIGTAQGWEIALSATITIASTIVVAATAARIYRNAIVRTGRRVGLREALRTAA
jgi:ABC-2 type transport system permease protein